jgi:hypothetical protein
MVGVCCTRTKSSKTWALFVPCLALILACQVVNIGYVCELFCWCLCCHPFRTPFWSLQHFFVIKQIREVLTKLSVALPLWMGMFGLWPNQHHQFVKHEQHFGVCVANAREFDAWSCPFLTVDFTISMLAESCASKILTKTYASIFCVCPCSVTPENAYLDTS